MIYLEKYTGEKTYMFPNCTIATPEVVLEQYPAILAFPHVIETDEAGQVFAAIENLSSMRTRFGIDPALSEDEAIAKAQEIMNAPQPEPEPSAEERIAAAMEYQVMASLPDEEASV